ncbi:MAG TPA: hypothetical protein VFR86_17145 [Burkholderiaceae bacterium]|nr:hypothetical protein [Burkholderiaceae bacterium]
MPFRSDITARALALAGALAAVVPPAAGADRNGAAAAPHRPPEPPAVLSKPPAEDVEVWVDLSEPPLATLPRDARQARADLTMRIGAQQNEVMVQLAALGAVELARVQHVRNALAVRLPVGALPQARAIPGVVNVRTVRHFRRDAP